MKFRVTYWPGTAKLRSCCVIDMEKNGELDRIARSYTILAQNWQQAQSQTVYLMNDSRDGGREGSDGCLIEYAKDCADCGLEYFTTAEDSKLCHTCGERRVTEDKVVAGPFRLG